MKAPRPPVFLEAERKSTDDSLVAEREKTNRSLGRARGVTEHQTDEAVSLDRVNTDRLVSSKRQASDSALEHQRELPSYDADDEQRLGDQRLRDERQRSDDALVVERSRTDGAVMQERVLNSRIAGRLLERERLLTDQNLKVERRQTDSEVDQTSRRLNREIAEHLRTKVSLTTRDEYIAIVTHDLRNPIGAASTALGLLLDESESPVEDVKYWIAFAKRNVDTSLRLIADLLDLERIAQGSFELNLEPHDIDGLITESLTVFIHAPSVDVITLRSKPTPRPGVLVCDHDRVMQILSNLINNAMKFTGDGGSITITAESSADETRFSVSDTGSGIPADKLERIFERFTQLGTKDRRGLGLGLYICKMFVEAHGGRIWAESEVGRGSTFYFTIPTRDA